MRSLLLLYLLPTICLSSPVNNLRRKASLDPRAIHFTAHPERAKVVKETFEFAWDGYYTYAFPADELHPVSNGKGNSRNGWGASAVDALSTAILMNEGDIVDVILGHIATIDWSVSANNDPVSVFETTIRYLGGLLSGYDLLTGPYAHLCHDNAKVQALLSQAKALADRLVPAFNTPTGIPDNSIDIATGSLLSNPPTTGLAVAGTLIIEWTHLSDLTGDPKYANLAQKAEQYLLRPQYAQGLQEPFPGMEGTDIALNSGNFLDMDGGWDGGTDSFYEYLLKMYVYDPTTYAEYKDRWVTAAESTLQYLVSSPSSRPDLTFVAHYENGTLRYGSSHLAGFIGGSFLLGGLMLGNQTYLDAGLQFAKSWHETYAQDSPMIGPELFSWVPGGLCTGPIFQGQASLWNNVSTQDNDGRVTLDDFKPGTKKRQSNSPPTNPACVLPNSLSKQLDFYIHSGFFVRDGTYVLRPEVLESVYYAYRLTGDLMYQDWAWNMIQAVLNATRANSGFTTIQGINSGGPVDQSPDNQESFFFAEVMKYAYIIFADVDAEWQVNSGGRGPGQGVDKWVFNTEAHLLKVRNGGS